MGNDQLQTLPSFEWFVKKIGWQNRQYTLQPVSTHLWEISKLLQSLPVESWSILVWEYTTASSSWPLWLVVADNMDLFLSSAAVLGVEKCWSDLAAFSTLSSVANGNCDDKGCTIFPVNDGVDLCKPAFGWKRGDPSPWDGEVARWVGLGAIVFADSLEVLTVALFLAGCSAGEDSSRSGYSQVNFLFSHVLQGQSPLHYSTG